MKHKSSDRPPESCEGKIENIASLGSYETQKIAPAVLIMVSGPIMM
jgi:hypothetical protein